MFIMLNPSTASETMLDPTVTRCVRFAQRWGHGAVEVVNVFAFRATRPQDLKRAPDPVGAGNDLAILAAAEAADAVIAAWGVHAVHRSRHQHVSQLLRENHIDTHCLRLTKDGHPGHPLYIAGSAAPMPMRWAETLHH